MDLKKAAWQAEDADAKWFEEISEYIFAHPELGDEEYESSAYLVEQMKKLGFQVTYPYLGIPTAFRCEYGDEDGPAVGFLAEYDALKGYGEDHAQLAHACGHNWIAASTFAACAALKAVKPYWKGKIVYIGTPAEENIGRKVDMADKGAFDGLSAAFQMHLDHDNMVDTVALAMTDFIFEFQGKAAHASGHPQCGINALEACNLTMAGINALRQHLESDVRIHYTVVDGGKSPNVVPDHASMAVYVRAGQKDYLEEVIERVLNCARGAELMTGAKFSCRRAQNTYYDMKRDEKLNARMKENLKALGIEDLKDGDRYHCGSSDIGNVSYHCPTCYCKLGTGAFSDANIHEEAYLDVACSKEAHRLLHIAAKAMAACALDVILAEQKEN
jgi:amidohydrolase